MKYGWEMHKRSAADVIDMQEKRCVPFDDALKFAGRIPALCEIIKPSYSITAQQGKQPSQHVII